MFAGGMCILKHINIACLIISLSILFILLINPVLSEECRTFGFDNDYENYLNYFKGDYTPNAGVFAEGNGSLMIRDASPESSKKITTYVVVMGDRPSMKFYWKKSEKNQLFFDLLFYVNGELADEYDNGTNWDKAFVYNLKEYGDYNNSYKLEWVLRYDQEINYLDISPSSSAFIDSLVFCDLRFEDESPFFIPKSLINIATEDTKNIPDSSNLSLSDSSNLSLSDSGNLEQSNEDELLNFIENARSKGMKTIIIKNGKYFLRKPLQINYSSISISGETKDGVILLPRTEKIDGLKLNADNCILNNLSFVNFNKAIIINSNNNSIRNCNFSNNTKGIVLLAGIKNFIENNSFVTARGKNNLCLWLGYSMVNVSQNQFNGEQCIDLVGASEANISSNSIETQYGIAMDNSSGSLISKNHIDCKNIALYLQNIEKLNIILNNVTGDIKVLDGCKGINIQYNNINSSTSDRNNKGKNHWDNNYWFNWDCSRPRLIYRNIFDEIPHCNSTKW
jgi:parallel beta-helix repeat protein